MNNGQVYHPLGGHRRPFDRERYLMLPRDAVAHMAHRALQPLNRMESEPLVAAIAMIFAVLCKRTGMSPQEAHDIALRQLVDEPHHTKANLQVQALRDFAGIQANGEKIGGSDGVSIL